MINVGHTRLHHHRKRSVLHLGSSPNADRSRQARRSLDRHLDPAIHRAAPHSVNPPFSGADRHKHRFVKVGQALVNPAPKLALDSLGGSQIRSLLPLQLQAIVVATKPSHTGAQRR
ncbi:hypothetical protein M0R45_005188 [Rubus argutus]|uniref:Uncharacterized protein n=1 Tax=Rubus argutus TaxID=59490 RepID=A0AAW1YLY8_RUBAR